MERIDWELLRSMSEGNNKVDLNDYILERWNEVSEKDKGLFNGSCKEWVRSDGLEMIKFIEEFIGG